MEAITGFVAMFFIIAVYFMPTIIAKTGEKDNVGAVFVLNLFLGWTFLGWVISLALAVGGKRRVA